VNRNRRGWTLYGVAWVPLFIGYTNLLVRMRGLSLGAALETSFVYVISAALLGVLVWHATGRIAWPERHYATFIGLQIVLAATCSLAWLAVIVLDLMARIGVNAATRILPSFDGVQFLIGLWVFGVIAGVSYALRVMGRLREREATAARAEALRMHAELVALRAQLNPSFLFDTLQTVSDLLQKDPTTARLAFERLSDLLQYVLDAKRLAQEDVTLADELGFVRDYLALEQLRLGDRLHVVEQIDLEALDCVIPTLTLQPLVENAIKHAIAPRASGGTITIGASLEGDQLILVIADDGPGAVEEGVRAARGLGLRAGRQRLENRYPKSARFIVTTAPGAGFTVTLMLPANITIVTNSYPVLPVG
jgi:two-component system LytT family sensor kinase